MSLDLLNNQSCGFCNISTEDTTLAQPCTEMSATSGRHCTWADWIQKDNRSICFRLWEIEQGDHKWFRPKIKSDSLAAPTSASRFGPPEDYPLDLHKGPKMSRPQNLETAATGLPGCHPSNGPVKNRNFSTPEVRTSSFLCFLLRKALVTSSVLAPSSKARSP